MGNNNPIISKNSIVLNIAAFIIIIAGVMYAQSLIAQLLMAFFISIICAQPIAWLQKKKVPQGFAITIVFILIVAELMHSRNVVLYFQLLYGASNERGVGI